MDGGLFLYIGLLMAGFAVFLLVSSLISGQQDSEALTWASGSEPVKSKSGFINFSRPLIHRFTIGHTKKVKSEKYRKDVAKNIGKAGIEHELNVDEYIGLQILWGVGFPIFLLLLNFTLELGLPVIFIFILGAVGAFAPSYHVKTLITQRRASVISDLPFFIELLALSTEAGLDFVAAIERITSKAEGSVLATELEKALKDIKLGSARGEAFTKMADKLDIPEITSFIVVLNDSDAQGVSVSKVLKQQSIQMRVDRFTRAEKAGAKASQLILVPMLVFILPAVFVIVFGPVILQFLKGGG